MFEAFRDFLHSIGGDAADRGGLAASDPRVAAAALLYHVAAADGTVTDAELDRLKSSIAAEFALEAAEAADVMRAGREADLDAVDLYRFTTVLMSRLDAERRVHFIERLWEVTYADGKVHELEDNTVWRIAELLGVSGRDRMLMKKRVTERQGGAG